MNAELATHQEQVMEPTPAQSSGQSLIPMIDKLVERPDFDVEKLERLLDMQERIMNRTAMEQFNAAMAEMQCEMPSIAERGKIIVKGELRSRYATFEDINDVVKPIMKRFGFAVSFRVEQVQGGIQVTGVLMHRAGHREETTMLLPHDGSGTKNAVQAVGSSVSYGKRYVMSALLNITTRGEDDDGESAAPTKFVTPFQAGQISHLASKCPVGTQSWLNETYGQPDRVPKTEFDGLCAHLNKIIQEAEGVRHADIES